MSSDINSLQLAAMDGDIEKVKSLLSVIDPKEDDSFALIIASAYGYLEIVKLLAPLSDPKSRNSQALRFAFKKKHTEVADFLIPLSDVEAVIRSCIHSDEFDIADRLILNVSQASLPEILDCVEKKRCGMDKMPILHARVMEEKLGRSMVSLPLDNPNRSRM